MKISIPTLAKHAAAAVAILALSQNMAFAQSQIAPNPNPALTTITPTSGVHDSNSDAAYVNYGVIDNSNPITFTNNPSPPPNAMIINDGSSIGLPGYGQIVNENGGTFQNNVGGTIINQNSGTIFNNGANISTTTIFNNDGTITNDTTSVIANSASSSGATAQFFNTPTGVINNFGVILNNLGALFTNTAGGSIDNNGASASITNDDFFLDGTAMQNDGLLTNENGASISNQNNATILNTGTITNATGATITNDGTSTLLNTGTITNSNVGGTGGPITNNNIFNNSLGGQVNIQSGTALQGTGTYTQSDAHSLTNIDGTWTQGQTNILGGVLSGSGTMFGPVSNTGGTVMPTSASTPGSGIGTLTINGSYTQGASGTLGITLKPGTNNSSMLVITGAPGTASLAGTLALTFQTGIYANGTLYDILEAASPPTGTFASVTGMPAGFTDTVFYDVNATNTGAGDYVVLALTTGGAISGIPEPSTWLVFGSAFLGMAFFRLRRREDLLTLIRRGFKGESRAAA